MGRRRAFPENPAGGNDGRLFRDFEFLTAAAVCFSVFYSEIRAFKRRQTAGLNVVGGFFAVAAAETLVQKRLDLTDVGQRQQPLPQIAAAHDGHQNRKQF